MASRKSTSKLPPFDDKQVIATTIAITNAGDGLSKALGVDPRVLHHGETVYVVLECEVTKVGFTPAKDAPANLIRVHTLKAGTSTIVDPELVTDVLTQQVLRLEEAAGIQRMFDADGQPIDPTSPGLTDDD